MLAARTPSLNLAVSIGRAKPAAVNAFASLLDSTLTSTASVTVDVTPPTVPVLTVQSATQTSVAVEWAPSVDDSGSVSYLLYLDGQSRGAGTSPAVFSGLVCGTVYQFGVEAVDASGNVSVRGLLAAPTAACPPTGGSGGGGGTVLPPKSSGPPGISGLVQVGQTLTTSNGTWTGYKPSSYAYQWQDCDAAGANCAAIAGATGNSYTLVAADQGYTIRAQVTGTNSAGSASVTSAQTSVVQAAVAPSTPPANTGLPVISGTATAGQLLSTSNGTWTGSASVTYSYQWQDCDTAGANCAAIAGATSSSYTLAAADQGYTVRARVTATNSAGTAAASSAQTAVVAVGATAPANTALPVVSGTATSGQLLSTTAGAWTGSAPIGYSYQWQDCDAAGANCATILGATNSTYTLVLADQGQTIRVRVTASNTAGGAYALSAQTAVVAASATAPANTAPPVVSGTATSGQQLSTSTGTWTGTPTITYTYQWQDCDAAGANCAAIAGATASSYTLTAADQSRTIRARVTATNSTGTAAASSAATAVVQAAPPSATAPANTAVPTVSGTTTVGQIVTTTTGAWTGTAPITYTYQWQQCNSSGAACTTIAGATANTYTLAGADAGFTIRSRVTAANSAGSVAARSVPTAVVAAGAATPPSGTGVPVVSGSAQVGQVLSTTNGTWSGTTPFTFVYQWQDCDSAGANCTAVSGATGSTYALTSVDQGHTVRARVTASNGAGSAAASSAQTAVVLAAPPPPAGLNGIHVSLNRTVDNNGNVIRLHGVNYSGTEYACVQGWGIFDGPSDQTMVTAMKSWHINIVRIPLNEDCWLNINGINQAYAGANYQNAIINFVNLLHQNGMYAELSLIWGAPGAYQATYQPGAPDADHSPAFWSSLAATFKNDQNVILAPWGETITGWTCFMQTGCSDQATYGPSNAGYQTAPMSQAVTVMRGAGFHGPVVIPCIDWANSCANYNGSSWLQSRPADPDNQLMAEAHVYGNQLCSSVSCFNTDYAPLAQQVPLIFGETGESYDSSLCTSTNISTFMNWADAHAVGYLAWTWDTWGGCGVLINNFNGTPANQYAQWVHDHYVTAFP